MDFITDTNFESEVLQSEKPVLVDFFATWCGPCRALSPVLEEVADEMKETVKIVKIDVDDAPKTPMMYDIQGIPALLIFKNGKVIAKQEGALPKQALIDYINANI